MKIYNTLTKKIEEFKPISGNRVGLYTCGPTVYDYAHLGHLRTFTMNDILVRVLKHLKYDLKFVQNITDVGHLTSDGDTGEDKLEKGAKKYGQSAWEIARKFEKHFFKSMDLMGNLRPDKSTRATEHIKEQLQMVIDLEKKGFAYKIDNDGIYFNTSRFEHYGEMAKLNLQQQKEGTRIDKTIGKRNASDFALWKFEREGENRAMVWKSPWAERSFPGWHIECSAMSMKYLGDQFDIHTGGIDHIAVHHTNEIAQSEAVTNKSPFVKYWIHHNFLKVNGEKMSKSLGNIFTIDDVIKRGFHPRALRLLFLTAHYQSEMNFIWDNLLGAQKSYQKLLRSIIKLKNKKNNQSTIKNNGIEIRNNFFSSLEHNLNTAQAVAIMWELIKSDLDSNQKLKLLMEFDEILNLGFAQAREILASINNTPIITKEIENILNERQKARDNHNFLKADELRKLLLKKGYRVNDLSSGQKIEKA